MNWQELKKSMTPKMADFDWLEPTAIRTITIVAIVVVILDTCIWRP